MSGLILGNRSRVGEKILARQDNTPSACAPRSYLRWVRAAAAFSLTVALVYSILVPSSPQLPNHPQLLFIGWSGQGLIVLLLLGAAYGIYQQIQSFRLRGRLIEAEKLFYLFGESGTDLIAIVDTRGNRIYNSPSYYTVLGYTPEDLKDTSGLDQIHPDDRALVVAAADAAKSQGTGRRLEYRIRHRNGTWRIFESTCCPVRDYSGQVDKLMIVNRDITAQREQAREILEQKEEQLRQAQKMEAIGRLSGGVAHDFNNLLSVIIGYAEDLEENLEPSGRLHKEAEEVRKAGERAASLTRQLLAFSRHHELERRVLDLNQVIGDLAKMLRRLIGSDIEFSLHLDPLAGRIKADQGQMEQVIMNLVVNARDAMPDGGRLLVSSGNIRLAAGDLARFPGAAPGDYTELTVTDTGLGMDALTLTHIFEPFFTTKEEGKGTGLGLATVAGIVTQCGGHIGATSEPGKGSTFRVLVPQTREALLSPGMKRRTLTATSVEHTVLLAEDDGALRELIADVLSRNGYRVLDAATPGAALRVLREFHAPIDLLLSDIVLPGMKGPELAAAVASIRPEIRVLYMSGYSETDPKTRQCLPTSAPFLCKPFTTETLLQAVSEAISPSIPEAV